MRSPEFWTKAFDDAEAVLLAPGDIARLNRRNASRAWAFQDVTKAIIGDHARIDREIEERHGWLFERLTKKTYVEAVSGSFARTKAIIDASERIDELRVLVRHADLRCIPMAEALYKPPVDPAFDRNQCSGLHAGELVRLLRRSTDGEWVYAHAGHSVGWLRLPKVTPPLTPEVARAFRDATPRLVITAPHVVLSDAVAFKMGATLPIKAREGDEVVVAVPTLTGIVERRLQPPAGTSVGFLPFTRRNVYEQALSYLDHPYGWGERGGGQDCSRLLLDVFSTFGVRLGRHSGEQAKAGVRVVDFDETTSAATRRKLLSEAMAEGIVFAYMPGHIMLMLGERDGKAYAVSAIAEFMEPCAGDTSTGGTAGDRTVRVDRVLVSDMTLGRGTKKTSFLERLTRLAVFAAPGAAQKNDPKKLPAP